jgi:hypothetical protein
MPYGDPAAREEQYVMIDRIIRPSQNLGPKEKVMARRGLEHIVTEAVHGYRVNPAIQDAQYAARLANAANMLNMTDPGGNWQDHPKLTQIARNWAGQTYERNEAETKRITAETDLTNAQLQAAMAAAHVSAAAAENTGAAAQLKMASEVFKLRWEPTITAAANNFKDPVQISEALMKDESFREAWEAYQKILIAASGSQTALIEVIRRNPAGFLGFYWGKPQETNLGTVMVPSSPQRSAPAATGLDAIMDALEQ